MECQRIFSRENKKNVTSLLPAELVRRVVKVTYAWFNKHILYRNVDLCPEARGMLKVT